MAGTRIPVSKPCVDYAEGKWKKLNHVAQDRIVPLVERQVRIVKKIGTARTSLKDNTHQGGPVLLGKSGILPDQNDLLVT